MSDSWSLNIPCQSPAASQLRCSPPISDRLVDRGVRDTPLLRVLVANQSLVSPAFRWSVALPVSMALWSQSSTKTRLIIEIVHECVLPFVLSLSAQLSQQLSRKARLVRLTRSEIKAISVLLWCGPGCEPKKENQQPNKSLSLVFRPSKHFVGDEEGPAHAEKRDVERNCAALTKVQQSTQEQNPMENQRAHDAGTQRGCERIGCPRRRMPRQRIVPVAR